MDDYNIARMQKVNTRVGAATTTHEHNKNRYEFHRILFGQNHRKTNVDGPSEKQQDLLFTGRAGQAPQL